MKIVTKKLTYKQIKQLKNYPENSRGHQFVDLIMKDGTTLTGIDVLNSSTLVVNEDQNIDPENILEIKVIY